MGISIWCECEWWLIFHQLAKLPWLQASEIPPVFPFSLSTLESNFSQHFGKLIASNHGCQARHASQGFGRLVTCEHWCRERHALQTQLYAYLEVPLPPLRKDLARVLSCHAELVTVSFVWGNGLLDWTRARGRRCLRLGCPLDDTCTWDAPGAAGLGTYWIYLDCLVTGQWHLRTGPAAKPLKDWWPHQRSL